MSKMSSAFQDVSGSACVYVSQIGKLWCAAIRLDSNALLLYSPPPALKGEALESLQELGRVEFVVAPNHYHNRGLKDARKLFSKAPLVCSKAARPRLSKVTGERFKDFMALTDLLPDHVRLLQPEGLKTGEIWFEVKSRAELIWVMADAFSSEGSASRPNQAELSMLGTFPKYGVADAECYVSWLARSLARAKPTMVVPGHGPPVKRRGLGQRMQQLADALA